MYNVISRFSGALMFGASPKSGAFIEVEIQNRPGAATPEFVPTRTAQATIIGANLMEISLRPVEWICHLERQSHIRLLLRPVHSTIVARGCRNRYYGYGSVQFFCQMAGYIAMNPEGSITHWICELEVGEADEAQEQIWHRYFGRLI